MVTKLGAATKQRECACNVVVLSAIKRLFVFLPVSVFLLLHMLQQQMQRQQMRDMFTALMQQSQQQSQTMLAIVDKLIKK